MAFGPAFAQGLPQVTQTQSYLDTVDYYLQRADDYTRQALADVTGELEAIRQLAPEKRFERMAREGRRLEQIHIDSAINVYIQGRDLAVQKQIPRYITKFTYRMGSVMPMMGLVREGIELYMSVNPATVDRRDKFDYFATGHHIFDAAVDYYRVDSLKNKYHRLSHLYNDSALMYVTPGSVEEIYYRALPKLSSSARKTGIAEMKKVLSLAPYDDFLYAKAAAEIASAYLVENDLENARYYLALSAISDLKSGTREATSLYRLGKQLSREQDYERAYSYLAYALEAAVESGSSLRTIEIGEIMPEVVKTSHDLEQQRSRTLVIIVISLSLAVIVFVFIIIYASSTRHRLNRASKKLVEINESKDLYIRKLLSLCGAYLTALENFNKVAGRKIKVGQVNELMAMIESGKVIRDQLQSFYQVFDEAFLAVYPDFVEQVNRLLLHDKPLALTEDGRLSTELRIVAFMRLGMDDTAQIARFLGLSVNTIYTYRNKVKTRAIHRDSFEDDVLKIGGDFEC